MTHGKLLSSTMTPVHQLGLSDILVLVAGFWLITKVVRRIANRNAHGTKLNGPPSESLIFGLTRKLAQAPDSGIVYQEWAAKYGPVFEIPTAFRRSKVILCDPRAVNHFYSMERSVYIRSKLYRAVVANLVAPNPSMTWFLADYSTVWSRFTVGRRGEP